MRKQIRELKKNYTLEDKKLLSLKVWERVEQIDQFKRAEVILAYWSMDDEVFTHDFVMRWEGKKKILLPCVKGGDLEIRSFEGAEGLCAGESFGIMEPVGKLADDLNEIDVVLVPGVAFDRCGHRLGRGKGYYDKILRLTSACKIGICFGFQLLDEVPVEEHDIQMDCVVTDNGGIK